MSKLISTLKNKWLWVSLFCIAALVIICLVIFFYINTFPGGFSTKHSEWGEFGSYIGGTLGAFFAFLSFTGLICTVFLQRKELETAIVALNKSAHAQEEQAKTYETQRFESTFYSLLQQHNDTLNKLGDRSSEFNGILSNLETEMNEDESLAHYLKKRQVHILQYIELSQYFRILYQLLKFVARNNINNTHKLFNESYLADKTTLDNNTEKMYASIVRSFVPVELLPVLALNCIPSYKGLNNLSMYWEMLERYEFLEHIRLDKMPDNLSTFLILNSYGFALGANNGLNDKLQKILAIYKEPFWQEITKGCYLHIYSTNVSSPF